MKNGIGNRIQQVRCENKISQVELADFLGVAQKDISRWENGEVSPSVESITKLCNFFSKSADYFLGLPDFQKCKYLFFSSRIRNGCVDEDVFVFNTLYEANNAAYLDWQHLTSKERKENHDYVKLVRDFMISNEVDYLDLSPLDSEYWYYYDYNLLEEVEGGFDSDNLESYFKWLGRKVEFN